MSPYVLAFLIGVVAGLRAMTAPAVVSWAACLGWLHLENTSLAFLRYTASPYILSALAIGELVADKLPKTPSRKAPPGFAARLVTGALCGAALAAGQSLLRRSRGGRDRQRRRYSGRLRVSRPAGTSYRRERSPHRPSGRPDRHRRSASDRDAMRPRAVLRLRHDRRTTLPFNFLIG